MKIVCTLKEFELLSARCPMNTFLIGDEKFEELYSQCHEHCLLSNFCKHGMDDGEDWSIADLVEIAPENILLRGWVMKAIKCKDCVLLDKCPSGQRCIKLIENFMQYCPVGKTKDDK